LPPALAGSRATPASRLRSDRARALADLSADPFTARDMLFSNPGAELPDVYLSESVVFVSEDNSGTENQQTYTVVLTHPPGMREDETVRAAPKRACEAGARGFVNAV
jgi:hypothetical protein